MTARLEHLTNIDQRQQKATALLLLLSDGKGEARDIRQTDTDTLSGHKSFWRYSDRSQSRQITPRAIPLAVESPGQRSDFGSSTGCETLLFPSTRERRKTRRKITESRSGSGMFSRGDLEGSRIIRNREGHFARSLRTGDGFRDHDRNSVRCAGSDSGTPQVITPSTRFAVGRDIARVRMGRRRMSDGVGIGLDAGLGGGAQPPPRFSHLIAEEARRVMFGFSPEFGRYSDREDMWL